ncbi:MAG: class I mannose-6-phosphate isomerase [Sebaldella sp.]|nr:class I mannose-6-phosphate isomerase [Sebaldella sp.]
MLYPLRFKKVFIDKIWGGRVLESTLGMELPDEKIIGESWEVSAHPNGMSIVENGELAGKTLQEVLDEYKEKLVGEKVYKEYKNLFPLLIKYLDINDRLSIQVHPSDEYAMKHEGELGKSESWYVIEASKDAKLILGMKDGMTKEKFLEKAKKNDFEDMFKVKPIKTGDFIDVNPGTVHASLEGSILIAEIQENSDVTYRIYDFDREENGVKRDLHIDKAAEVIDFGMEVKVESGNLEGSETKKRLVSKKYYTIDKIKVENSKMEDFCNESLIIYSILDGKGSIKSENHLLDIKKGESILIPVNVKVEVEGNLELLRTII